MNHFKWNELLQIEKNCYYSRKSSWELQLQLSVFHSLEMKFFVFVARMLWKVTSQREKMLNCRVVHAVALLLPGNQENVGEQHLLLEVVKALAAFTSCCSEECAQQVRCCGTVCCEGPKFRLSFCFAVFGSFWVAVVTAVAGRKLQTSNLKESSLDIDTDDGSLVERG